MIFLGITEIQLLNILEKKHEITSAKCSGMPLKVLAKAAVATAPHKRCKIIVRSNPYNILKTNRLEEVLKITIKPTLNNVGGDSTSF